MTLPVMPATATVASATGHIEVTETVRVNTVETVRLASKVYLIASVLIGLIGLAYLSTGIAYTMLAQGLPQEAVMVLGGSALLIISRLLDPVNFYSYK